MRLANLALVVSKHINLNSIHLNTYQIKPNDMSPQANHQSRQLLLEGIKSNGSFFDIITYSACLVQTIHRASYISSS